MKDLIIWSISAFALCWVAADSKLTVAGREWLSTRGAVAGWLLTLLECVACSGWHLGWIAQLLGLAPFDSWWLAAFYTCGSNLLLAKYVGLLDE